VRRNEIVSSALLIRVAQLAVFISGLGCSEGTTTPPSPTPLTGQLIAYWATTPSRPAGLWLAQADGQNSRVITPDTLAVGTPAWSPGGSSLAFALLLLDRAEINVMNADGTGRTRIDNGRTRSLDPTWSPDGQRIAFASGPAANETLYVMNRDGTNATARAPSVWSDRSPAWSPDGALIAFTSLRDPPINNVSWRRLFLMNADGSNVHRLAPDRDLVAYSPAWSPNGAQLAFEARPSTASQSDIYILTLATGDVRQLTTTLDNDAHPTWSPDGTRIAFSRQSSNVRHIYSVAADGSDLRQITSGTTQDFDPAFRPMP
jgi:Tol biopolymer transport system component